MTPDPIPHPAGVASACAYHPGAPLSRAFANNKTVTFSLYAGKCHCFVIYGPLTGSPQGGILQIRRGKAPPPHRGSSGFWEAAPLAILSITRYNGH